MAWDVLEQHSVELVGVEKHRDELIKEIVLLHTKLPTLPSFVGPQLVEEVKLMNSQIQQCWLLRETQPQRENKETEETRDYKRNLPPASPQ